MVAFQHISRSTGRQSIRDWSTGSLRVTKRQVRAAEQVLGRALRRLECVFWLSETQPIICDRNYVALMRRVTGRTRPDYLSAASGKRLHVLKAERALGRSLPKGAVVHHVDENKWNNTNSNLVICQDHAYHMLLHARAKVVRAGGDPATQRVCRQCGLLPLDRFGQREYGQCRACINKAKRDSWPASRGRAERTERPRQRAVRSDAGKRRVT